MNYLTTKTPFARFRYVGVALSGMVLLPASVSYAGTGLMSSDPLTGLDVTNLMDAGTSANPKYYLISSTYHAEGVAPMDAVLVGDAGQCDILDINSGGALLSARGYIGKGVESTSSDSVSAPGYGNRVTVSDTGSWVLNSSSDAMGTAYELDVGFYGCRNALNIIRGGSVNSGTLYVGYGSSDYSASGGYNAVTVGDPDTSGDTSLLKIAGDAVIGYLGSSNSLTIQSGADVTTAGAGYIGFGAASDIFNSFNSANGLGYGNSVAVKGAGSTWSLFDGSYHNLLVGNFGCSNALSVTDGGLVSCNYLTIGTGSADYGNGATGGSNSVTVGAYATMGDTSKIEVNGNLYVGEYGSDNTLTIQSGADVTTASNAYIGYGYLKADATAYSTNASNGYGYNNSVTVTGWDSTWTMSVDGGLTNQSLYVGYYGFKNSLTITDGGAVSCINLEIGHGSKNYGALGGYNSVTVGASGTTGEMSSLSVNGNLNVGFRSCDNTLTVQSGADATVTGTGYIGYGYDTSTNVENGFGYGNKVVVKGFGSTLNFVNGGTNQTLNVGYYGCSNTLQISDGGRVEDGDAYIGNQATSVGNIAVVSGNGSEWYNSGTLYVGLGGQGSLIIDDGALVTANSVSFGSPTLATISLEGEPMNGVTSLLTTDTSLVSVNANTIYLGSGSYLALNGNLTLAENSGTLSTVLSGVMVYDGSEWVAANSVTGSSIISYSFVDGTTVTSSSLTNGSYTTLTNYTVFSYTAVPEPSTCAFFGGLGAIGFALLARRRRK
jgi:fibronectin-binding autotransporter adhesin